MQTHIPRARHDHLCLLAAVLQRTRRRTIPRSTYQDEKLLPWVWSRLKDTVSLPGVSLQFLLRGTHQHHKKNQPRGSQKGGLRHAKKCSRRRAKSRLHKVSRSLSHTHLITPIRQCTPLPKGCGLQRRRSIPFDIAQAHALRTWSCSVLRQCPSQSADPCPKLCPNH